MWETFREYPQLALVLGLVFIFMLGIVGVAFAEAVGGCA